MAAVQEFQNSIESDGELLMLFTLMFEQTPEEFSIDPLGNPQVRNYKTMLKMISQVITQAPEFSESFFVGFPINAMLNYPMSTKAGFAAFLHPKVNRHIKAILSEWNTFLSSPASLYVLCDNEQTGWFGKTALAAMLKSCNSTSSFEHLFQCDPSLPHYGFRSWDDFFTRQFNTGIIYLTETEYAMIDMILSLLNTL